MTGGSVGYSGRIIVVQCGLALPGVDTMKACRRRLIEIGSQTLDFESFGSVKRREDLWTVISAFFRMGEVKEMLCSVNIGGSLASSTNLAFFATFVDCSEGSDSRGRFELWLPFGCRPSNVDSR